MNEPTVILKEWSGRGWWVRLTDDRETPLRVNTASAAPDGQQAMRRQDAVDLAAALQAAALTGSESRRCQGCEDAPIGQHTGPHDWELTGSESDG